MKPTEKLQKERERLNNLAHLQELKLKSDFKYIKRNSGKLIVSGASTLLFPKDDDEVKKKSNSSGFLNNVYAIANTFKGTTPLMLELALPFVLKWGFNRSGKLLGGKLFGSKLLGNTLFKKKPKKKKGFLSRLFKK